MRRQSSLGRPTRATGNFNNTQKIERAEIVRINRETSTADIRLLNNGELITSKDAVYGVRILKKFGGYNRDTGESYGEQISYHEGDIVVVGYLDGKCATPIILGSLDYLNNTDNPMQDDGSSRSFVSYPDQTYEKKFDNGEYERTFPQGFEVISQEEITPVWGGFNTENLTQKSKVTQSPQGKFSSVFSYMKRLRTRTGDFIHSVLSNGTIINKLETGDSSIGSMILDGNYTMEKVNGSSYSKVHMNSTQLILSQKMGGTSSITLTNGDSLNVNINGKASITISSSGAVSISSVESIGITGKSVNISGSSGVSISSGSKVSISAPKIDIG